MEIILGLRSGNMKELEPIIEKLADNFYNVELEYNTKEENNVFVYNLYATKQIESIHDLRYALDTINDFLQSENEKGGILLHITIVKNEKEIYKYHYCNNDLKKLTVLDLIK